MPTSSRSVGVNGPARQSDTSLLAEQSESLGSSVSERLQLRVHYPTSDAAVLTVRGEVDDANLERLTSLVHQRMSGLLDVFVLDFSDVDFLSLSAVEVLARANHYARTSGPQLRLVFTTPAVRRAVQAAELQQLTACYSSLSQALPALSSAESTASVSEQDTPGAGL